VENFLRRRGLLDRSDSYVKSPVRPDLRLLWVVLPRLLRLLPESCHFATSMSPVRTRSQEALALEAEEAELLAAAQAQARAEDEIQGRLPWEVLNINKHLDRQQKSVDELQGNISKLTDMVSQLGKSWNSTESSRSGHGTVPDTHSVGFSTPPHNTHLSPILEGDTPISHSSSGAAHQQ
jgi:hypothetical protein